MTRSDAEWMYREARSLGVADIVEQTLCWAVRFEGTVYTSRQKLAQKLDSKRRSNSLLKRWKR